MGDKLQCSYMRWRGGVSSPFVRCAKGATTTFKGKPYCKTHNPELADARQARRNAETEELFRAGERTQRRERLIAEFVGNVGDEVLERYVEVGLEGLIAFYEAENPG